MIRMKRSYNEMRMLTYHNPNIPNIHLRCPLHTQHDLRCPVNIRLDQTLMLVANAGFSEVAEERDSPATPALLAAKVSRLVDNAIAVNLPWTGFFFLKLFPF